MDFPQTRLKTWESSEAWEGKEGGQCWEWFYLGCPLDICMKISNGQFVVYTCLDLSREVSVRNIYLHLCVFWGEKVGKEEITRENNFSETKRREGFLKDWPAVLNGREVKYKTLTSISALVSAEK